MTTLSNGKQESFWANLEGRLMEMLDGVANLTLDFLNQATQAWVEIEYNRATHREIGCSPVERFARACHVMRDSPCSDQLRAAFRIETRRCQRLSDGTISLEGVRFEIPARFRHLTEVTIRYPRWDLARVDLVDERSDTILAPIYPLDRTANADGRRSVLEPTNPDGAASDGPQPAKELPPLLKRILQEYSATGIPPAYVPKPPKSEPEGEAP